MGRPSTIETHPRRDAIVAEIRAGRTLTEIGARYGVSLQAMSRFVISRKSQLVAELDEDGISVSSLVQRLADVADAAREARRQATYATPATRSRALEAEARVLVPPYQPTSHPLLDPISIIQSFYVSAERVSRRLGVDPDAPRLLNKVTETR